MRFESDGGAVDVRGWRLVLVLCAGGEFFEGAGAGIVAGFCERMRLVVGLFVFDVRHDDVCS